MEQEIKKLDISDFEHAVYTNARISETFEWCIKFIGPEWHPSLNTGTWSTSWLGASNGGDFQYLHQYDWEYRFLNEQDAMLFALKWTKG